MVAGLDQQCEQLMAAEHHEAEVQVSHFADLAYVGQSYFLPIPVEELDATTIGRLYDDFLAAHHRVYGHSMENPVRIVNLRTVHRVVAHSSIAGMLLLYITVFHRTILWNSEIALVQGAGAAPAMWLLAYIHRRDSAHVS